MAESTPLLRVALLATLALVVAFVVSALAGLAGWGEGAGGDRTPPRGSADPRRPAPTDTPAHTLIRVEVLNGAGGAGLARDVTHRLRGDGFDVVFFGNAARFDHARSVVVDRVGDPVRARAVARALGIDTIAAAPDSSLLLDVSVVLGEDWPLPPPPRKGWLDRARDRLRRPDSTP